jgi:hypothetical protein
MNGNELTASPTAPKPKITTLDPGCTLAVFHAAPIPDQVHHHFQMSKIRKYISKVSLKNFVVLQKRKIKTKMQMNAT